MDRRRGNHPVRRQRRLRGRGHDRRHRRGHSRHAHACHRARGILARGLVRQRRLHRRQGGSPAQRLLGRHDHLLCEVDRRRGPHPVRYERRRLHSRRRDHDRRRRVGSGHARACTRRLYLCGLVRQRIAERNARNGAARLGACRHHHLLRQVGCRCGLHSVRLPVGDRARRDHRRHHRRQRFRQRNLPVVRGRRSRRLHVRRLVRRVRQRGRGTAQDLPGRYHHLHGTLVAERLRPRSSSTRTAAPTLRP